MGWQPFSGCKLQKSKKIKKESMSKCAANFIYERVLHASANTLPCRILYIGLLSIDFSLIEEKGEGIATVMWAR